MPTLCTLSLVFLATLSCVSLRLACQPTSHRVPNSKIDSNCEQISLDSSHTESISAHQKELISQEVILETDLFTLESSSPKSHNLERKKRGVDCQKVIENTLWSSGYGGGLGGAAAGAAFGSVIPGVGTIVGALWGAGMGLLGGSAVGVARAASSECVDWSKP